MKKAVVFICLAVVASFIACNNEEEPIHFNNYSPVFAVVEVIDKEGRNLLDADIEGNIRENGIKVLKGEKTYYVKDLDKAPWETKDAYIKDNTLNLHLFSTNIDTKQVVEIDWGNGCKNTIEHRLVSNQGWSFLVNGEKAEFKNPKLYTWITIVIK